jgi:ABC-type sugar transport system permease subunit
MTRLRSRPDGDTTGPVPPNPAVTAPSPRPARQPLRGRALTRPRNRRDGRTALLFLVPLLVMYLVYFAYSFYFLLDTSFTKVSISFSNPMHVGWHNYTLLLKDADFRRAILNNVGFAVTTIAVSLTVAFFIATVLATGVRAQRLYYVIFLVPVLMPVALVSSIFASMLAYTGGTLNQALRAVGLSGLTHQWLSTSPWAIASIVGLFAYLIGLPIMYYTADLTTIRTDVVEAAVIDGAGPFRIMRSVLHPMMRSTHITVVLALLLGSFRAFEVVFLTTGGGPGNSTQIVGNYIYGFVTSSGSTIGYASAASVLVLAVALLVAVLQTMIVRRGER